MKTLDSKALSDVVRGASLLGSGGGGGYQVGQQLAAAYPSDPFYEGAAQEIEVVAVNELVAGRSAIVAAYLGAPAKTAFLTIPEAAVAAVQKISERKGRPVDYILPVEVGGISTPVACLTAAKLGIPVIDADGAGRAVPTLQLLLYSARGFSINPVVLASEKQEKENGEVIDNQFTIFEVSSDTSPAAAGKIEALARPALGLEEFDELAGLALWFIEDVAELQDALIPDTLSLSYELGQAIAAEQESGRYDSQAIIDVLQQHSGQQAASIYKGKLVSASTNTAGGFDFGDIQIRTDDGRDVRILFQNENLLLWDSEEAAPRVMAPDLISTLIVKNGQATTPGQIWVCSNDDFIKDGTLAEEYEQADIEVLAIQVSEILRDPTDDPAVAAILDNYLSILRTLNYYGPYVPVNINS